MLVPPMAVRVGDREHITPAGGFSLSSLVGSAFYYDCRTLSLSPCETRLGYNEYLMLKLFY